MLAIVTVPARAAVIAPLYGRTSELGPEHLLPLVARSLLGPLALGMALPVPLYSVADRLAEPRVTVLVAAYIVTSVAVSIPHLAWRRQHVSPVDPPDSGRSDTHSPASPGLYVMARGTSSSREAPEDLQRLLSRSSRSDKPMHD